MDIIGVIPRLPPGRASVQEQGQLVDSFMKLRLALRPHFTWGEPVTLTVTSILPMEGKTFVAANLSLNFADAGFRTLFVDGDHRSPGASALFGVPIMPGLREFQRGERNVEAVVHSTSYVRCHVLPYGSGKPSRASDEEMKSVSLVDELRSRFDVVIVDCPWWGTDQQVDGLAARMDGCVVVKSVGDTEGRSWLPDRASLSRIPIRSLGVVLIGSQIPSS